MISLYHSPVYSILLTTMGNYLLTIAYDGSGFHGWQKQPAEETVQGHLEQTFSCLFDRQISLDGTSRTDAGVHALGQRASFSADLGIPTERLARVMNNALCGREEGSFALSPIRILEAKEIPEDFHARFDSKGKKYIYRILPGRTDIFRRNYVYHIAGSGRATGEDILDVKAMDAAAKMLVGTHDFKSFEASGGTPRETTVRTMFEAGVYRAKDPIDRIRGSEDDMSGSMFSQDMWPGDEILFEVAGDGFLYNMVRIMTGTLVEIGQGRRAPEEIKDIIEAKDRSEAGHTAPPYGLYLYEVYYDL